MIGLPDRRQRENAARQLARHPWAFALRALKAFRGA